MAIPIMIKESALEYSSVLFADYPPKIIFNF